MVVTKASLIFRDILYAVMIIAVLWPGNVLGLELWIRVFIIVMALGQRIWQHSIYYKATGKIY